MIRLTSTDLISLITAQNGARAVVSYSDATGSAYTGGREPTSITSATTTTICSSPGASIVRDIDFINIKNTFAGSHTITVQLNVSATLYVLVTMALLTDESLCYTHGSGWCAIDANGNRKEVTSSIFSSITDTGLTSGRVVYAGTGGLLQDSANLTFNGTTLTANTIGAFTLSGTIAGGGNQLNNIIIGTTTPLAGSFTALAASGALTGVTAAFTKATAGDTVIFTNGAASNKTGYLGTNDSLIWLLSSAGGGGAGLVITSGTNVYLRSPDESKTIAVSNAGSTVTGTLGVTGATTINASLIGSEIFAVANTGTNNGMSIKVATAANTALLVWNAANGAGDNIFQTFYTETSITARGSIDYNRAGGAVRYNTTSDMNLKTLIGDAPRSVSTEILRQTRLREFYWNDDSTKRPQIGPFAQELYETYKGAVSVGVGKQGDEDYRPWGVDKTAFSFHLVAGWQDHESQIQSLLARLGKAEAALSRITIQ